MVLSHKTHSEQEQWNGVQGVHSCVVCALLCGSNQLREVFCFQCFLQKKWHLSKDEIFVIFKLCLNISITLKQIGIFKTRVTTELAEFSIIWGSLPSNRSRPVPGIVDGRAIEHGQIGERTALILMCNP